MSEKQPAVDLKVLEDQPGEQLKARPRRNALRKKLWLVGLMATYCLVKGGIMAWNATAKEDWAYEVYEFSLQALHSDETEKLFL